MAKNIDKDTVKALSTKNYYSWLKEGEANTEFIVSGSFGSLAFDAGSGVGTEVADIILKDGSTNAKVKTIASTYSYAGAASTTAYAPKSLTVFGVDATTIYGGAVISTKQYNYTSIYAGANSTYAGTNVVVNGGANLKLSTVKASAVYGGGAGYGSILDGGVNISVVGTNSISNLFGGGQKGAVVNGDVTIDIDRTDARSGRISNVWGGGLDAVVNGNVNITIHGVNAESIGSVSGSGKGNKAQVTGYRTLTIADYSGKFTTTIKDFDKIVLESGTAITLTQSQQKSIMSADYQFMIDERSVNQANAMLTWNKNIDTANFYVTIDSEFAATQDDAFTTTIYSSNQLTQSAFDKASWKVYGEDGEEITSGYELKFVADEKNGKVQKKGGSVVLSYVGSKSELNADSADTELTDAADKVQIKGDLVRASLDTKGGDDRVTVQTGTLMAGDIYLGTGANTLNVQSDAEVTGSVVLADGTAEKRVKNTININGTIAQIEGGNEFTDNVVNINSEFAVGYWNNRGSEAGDRWADQRNYNVDSLDREAVWVAQDLNFTSGSNDKVYVSTSSGYQGNINFAKGADTLVLNADQAGTVTAEDGNDMIVANKTGVTLDASTLKLSGTDNVFVASNGVYANIKNAGAIGNFESKYAGLYLSQNAMINVNNGTEVATMSYDGVLDLSKLGRTDAGAITEANLTILPVAEQLDRVSEFYTAGTGVNADINASGNDITFRAGAVMNGTVYADENGTTLEFMGTAGGKIYFDNQDGITTSIQVDKNAVATVGNIDGIDGTTYEGADDFDDDLAHVDLKENAALYEVDSKRGANLIVGNITKDVTDFKAAYGVETIDQITVADPVNANVTFADANVYTAADASFTKDVNFAGKNAIAVKTDGLVFDDSQLKFAEGATAAFAVLDGGLLIFDGIKNGETYQSNITVSYDQNARFAYGDTMYTKSWDRTFTADELYARGADDRTGLVRENVTFVSGATLESGIDLTEGTKGRADRLPGIDVTVEDGVVVSGELGNVEDWGAITLGAGEDTLTIGKAEVNGQIIATGDGNTDAIALKGSTVNAMVAQDAKPRAAKNAILLDSGKTGDTLEMTDGALVNGNIVGGKHLHVTESTVKGSINGDTNVLVNANIGTINGGETLVERKSADVKVEDAVTNIGTIDVSDNSVTLWADAATAKIGAIQGLAEGEDYDYAKNKHGLYHDVTLEARNGAKIELAAGIETVVRDANFTAIHNGSEVKFNGDVKLVTKRNVTMSAKAGGELTGLGNIQVSGGIDTDGDAIAAMDKIVKNLDGTLEAADTVTIESITTDVTGLEADVDADKKTVSNLTAGDVNLVAENSYINMSSEGSVNTFGAIRQSGAIKQSGYPLEKTDAIQQVTVFENADEAKVQVFEASSFKADSITQYADDAVVAFNGTAEVTNGIVQGAARNNKLGIEEAKAGTAEVTFNGATTLKGSINQFAETSATVDADVNLENSYTIFERLSDLPNEDIVIDKLNSVIEGDIAQTARSTEFDGNVEIVGDGKYGVRFGLENRDVHKRSVINVGEVVADYDNITQNGTTGGTNTVDAGLAFVASGESDVTVGKATLTMGAISQYSDAEGIFGLRRTVNDIDISLSAEANANGWFDQEGTQSVLTLKGNVTGNVGAVKQTAFRNNNVASFGTERVSEFELVEDKDPAKAYGKIVDEGVTISLSVASIEMLAYAGDNDLDLTGNVTVEGNVTVGGVLKDDKYVDYAWGDRVANANDVDVDVDTVNINGKLSMIGLENTLTLSNDDMIKTDLHVNAKDGVYLAANKNTVDIDYGVVMDNVTLESLKDADLYGADEYELGTGNYANTFIIRGTLGNAETETKVGYKTSQESADDTLKVYGGQIIGDVETQNGTDAIYIGNVGLAGTDDTGVELKNKVMGGSTIDGNVTMGVKGAAEGTNKIAMKAFSSKTLTSPDQEVGNSVAINGSVEMYSGKKGTTAAKNELSLGGDAWKDDNGYMYTASAAIAGGVTMDAAVSFDANGNAEEQGTNEIKMGLFSSIGGDVKMTAYVSNDLEIRASQEIVSGDLDAKAYADIAGTVEMSANDNSISVKASAETVNEISGAAAYMNGIKMSQTYKEGETPYMTTVDGNLGENTITVGNTEWWGKIDFFGDASELIVGKSVKDLANVRMGNVEFTKPGAATAHYVLDSVDVAERGHDIITYSDDQTEQVESITDANTIDVYGRFAAKDVKMVADENEIKLRGQGTLAKDKPETTPDEGKITEAVRTATFTAEGEIIQMGVTSNTIDARGYLDVEKFVLDEEGNKVKVDELESAQFNAGKISQTQFTVDETTATDNTVSLTGSIVATTGAIEQLGNGDNAVEVDGYVEQYRNWFFWADKTVAEVRNAPSSIASISQTSMQADDDVANTIDLDNTNVGGKIEQIAAKAGNDAEINGKIQNVWYYDLDAEGEKVDNPHAFQKSYAVKVGGDLTQDGAFNNVVLNEASVTGKVSQKAVRGVDENDQTYANNANFITAAATVTDDKKMTAEGGDCEIPGHLNHDVESVIAGGFNTQTVGEISQSFDNGDEDTVAFNTATLTNVKVGAVGQTGAGYVENSFTQTARAVAKLGVFVGEKTIDKKDVNKTAEYQDVQTGDDMITVGAITQSGTVNEVDLTSVKANAVSQAAKQDANNTTKATLNKITLKNLAAVNEAYVDEMGYNENGEEATEPAVLKGSANKYAKTSIGAILQTIDVQANYDAQVTNEVTATNAADITGDVKQGVVLDAEGKPAVNVNLANVKNTMTLNATDVKLTDINDQTGAHAGATRKVTSSVSGAVAQNGYENVASVTGTIGGEVVQTANLIEKYGEPNDLLVGQKVAATANQLTVNGVANARWTYTDDKGETQQVGEYAEEIIKGSVGDVTQTVNDALAKDGFLDNVAGNNQIDLGDKTTVGADFGNVTQTTTYGKNVMKAFGSAYTKGAKVVLNGTSVTQTGNDNVLRLTHVALKDDAATTDVVEGKITQTAMAVSGNTDVKVEGAKTTTTSSMNMGNNFAQIKGESSMVGIKQELQNVEYDKKVVEEAGVDPVKTKANTSGWNKITATDGYRNAVVAWHDKTKSVDASATNPDVLTTKGEFVGTIGDVDQDLTSFAKKYDTKIKTNFNKVELTDYNAGNIDQAAVGYATNIVTSTVEADTMQYSENAGNKYQLDLDEKKTAGMKSTITSINQKGFANSVDLTRTTVSNGIDQHATINATQTVDDKGATVWVFAEGSNTVVLNNVNVSGGVKSITDMEVVVDAKEKKTSDVAAPSTISMIDSHVDNIVTGSGKDTVTLGMIKIDDTETFDAVGTKVTGEIDLGKWSGVGQKVEEDTLNIMSDKVDLTNATVKNVETVNVANGISKLEVKSIQADKIDFKNSGDYETIYTEEITVGTVNGVDNIKYTTDDKGKANKLTASFTDDVTLNQKVDVFGSSTVTNDTVNIGDGVVDKDDKDNVAADFFDIDFVNFAANSSANFSNWLKTKDGVASNDTLKVGITFAEGDNSVVVGNLIGSVDQKIGDTTYEGYGENNIVITYGKDKKEYTYSDGAWKNANDAKSFTLLDGTLTYA